MFNRRIYLDYASLTPIDKRVMKEMKKYSSSAYANASSWYKEGVAAKKALNEARKKVAGYIHANSADEIIFTSGGTEANNMAILGSIEWLHEQGVEYEAMHVLISAIEHSSVRECANHLNDKGVQIDTVNVKSNGIVDLDDLRKKILPNTAMVSIMAVNNEIGSIQPIREIAKIIRQSRAKNLQAKAGVTSIFNFQSEIKYPLFHTDAAQGLLLDLNVEQLGVDFLTLDGSKVYGPRGIGALYHRHHIPLAPIIYGGGQENGLRSGTENIAGIMGFAKALELVHANRYRENARLASLRAYFVSELKLINKDITVNGDLETSSTHIANISIPGIDSEFFVLQLDARGIACSTKSSCLRDESESFVLKAIGANSKTSIRFSFGRNTKISQIKKTIRVIGELLRAK